MNVAFSGQTHLLFDETLRDGHGVNHYAFKKSKGYDQEIQKSQTVVKPMAPRGKATQQSRNTRKTYKAKQPALSSPLR